MLFADIVYKDEHAEPHIVFKSTEGTFSHV
jgi:hypothetical protein